MSEAPGSRAAPDLMPLASGERIVTIDVLRGIALFGVLAANLAFDFSGLRFLPWSTVEAVGREMSLDSVAPHFQRIFISGKARTTFEFLFGLGFAVLMLRAEGRGRSIVPLYVRRLTVLFTIGLLHALLLFWGDILFRYAAFGMLLLLFRRFADRALMAWAAVLILIVTPAVRAAPVIADVIRPDSVAASADAITRAERNEALLRGFSSQQPARILAANVQALAMWWVPPGSTLLLQSDMFGVFLLGLYVGRKRVFEQVSVYRPAFRRIALWGLSLGLIGSTLLHTDLGLIPSAVAQLPRWLIVPTFTGLADFATVALAAGYVAAATLLLHDTRARAALAHFAPVGRMALTNYLAQSVICVSIVYGSGLVGTPAPALWLGLALVIFAVQMVWSAWWLRSHRFGPMEWLWRSLTYGRMQPMRVSTPAPVLETAG